MLALGLAVVVATLGPELREALPPGPHDATVILERPGDATTVDHATRAEFTGLLHAWAAPPELARSLTVTAEGGAPLAWERRDGSRHPYGAVRVAAGQRLVVTVELEPGRGADAIELHLVAAPDTPEVMAAGAAGREDFGALIAASRAGDRDEVIARAEAVLERFERAPGNEFSEAAAIVRWMVGFEANDVHATELALRAWDLARLHRQRTLPPDHVELQQARLNLALLLRDTGRDRSLARAFQEAVVDALEGVLPEDAPDLLSARTHLASTLAETDPRAASEVLERVLAVGERTLDSEDAGLQDTRHSLAITLTRLGRHGRARDLLERSRNLLARTREPHDRQLMSTSATLAIVLERLGDEAGALVLHEQVLAARAATLPDDHLELQRARMNLSVLARQLGRAELATALDEKVHAVLSARLSEDDPFLQRARTNLAIAREDAGDLDEAERLFETVLAARRDRPESNEDLQKARLNLARVRERRGAPGDLDRARELREAAFRALTEREERDDLLRFRAARDLARLRATMGDEAGADELALELCRDVRAWVDASAGRASARELEERAGAVRAPLLWVLDRVEEDEGTAALERELFATLESARGVSLARAAARRTPSARAVLAELRAEHARSTAEVARAVRTGVGVAAAVERRDAIERSLAASSPPLPAPVTVERLASRLAPDQAVVTNWFLGGRAIAFVVRGDGTLHRASLGARDELEGAVARWRRALLEGAAGAPPDRGVGLGEPVARDPGDAGRELFELVLGPLEPHLDGVRYLTLVPDGALHAVPLDALPFGDGLLGDRFELALRSTLRVPDAAPVESAPALLALGGVDYGPVEATARPDRGASWPLRGTPWEDGFAPLPGSAREVRAVEALHRTAFEEEAERVLLEASEATRDRVEELVPRARFVHLASHGWFAPESVGVASTRAPLDPHLELAPASAEVRARSLSPLALCGLALAPSPTRGASGLVTAEEIASWDLTDCELAVLSACESGVGVARAGHGVASLQKAFRMAGARRVLASLWKVPDDATAQLMTELYRRLWIEGLPASRALWEAKSTLRAAGLPPRAWAGWVLAGEAD